jgi:cytochrome c peroxidase
MPETRRTMVAEYNRFKTASGASIVIAVLAAACLAAQSGTAGPRAHPGGSAGDEVIITKDSEGKLGTASTNSFNGGITSGFFTPLGPNGRSCNTCHRLEDAWTFTPDYAKQLARTNVRDPLFAPVDGSDCPPVSARLPDARNSSMVVEYGLIREEIGIPSAADYALYAATNPKHCLIPPGSAAISGRLILYRRPLPSANLTFLSDVRWDARETVQPVTTGPGLTAIGALLFDLGSQANHASMTHEESQSILDTQALADMVAFEQNLYTAQLSVKSLDLGSQGGPGFIAHTLARGFFVGQNDPLGKDFSRTVFTLYSDWEPGHYDHSHAELTDLQKSIGEGEHIFNSRTFAIANVQGLNSAKGDPLYNPADPLAGKLVIGTCGTCHNTPNIGNHSTPMSLNIGVTSAVPVDNSGRVISGILDTKNLPIYTLRSVAGAMVRTTDPGRALISGRWVDVGKTKVPALRGLAARPPYFHNGSAKDLAAVIAFHNARFNIGLTPQESHALIQFLSAL